MRISPHFRADEFSVGGSLPLPVNETIRSYMRFLLEVLRTRMNADMLGEVAIIPTSGRRSPEHNAEVGGSKTSKHLEEFGGHAIDFKAIHLYRGPGTVIDPSIVFEYCVDLFDFVKPYEMHTHVDMREEWERLREERGEV